MKAPWHVRLLRRVTGWAAARTPAQRLRLAARLAPLAGLLARKRVHVARTNLRLCFPGLPEAAREALLRRMLVANLKGLLDACTAWYAPAIDLAALYEIEGEEHLRAALARGEGVVLLGAHNHGSELHMRAARALAGQAVLPMVRPFSHPAVDAEINARRGEHLGGVIARGDVRALCAAVRAGGIAVYTPDVNVRTRNVFAPFFGVPASTLGAIGNILRRAGGTVVPTFAIPLADGRYRLRFEPPLAGFPGANPLDTATRYNRWVEACVRQAPEAYDWGVKRFKTRPPGEPGLYD